MEHVSLCWRCFAVLAIMVVSCDHSADCGKSFFPTVRAGRESVSLEIKQTIQCPIRAIRNSKGELATKSCDLVNRAKRRHCRAEQSCDYDKLFQL
jgi:hypothetical protein